MADIKYYEQDLVNLFLIPGFTIAMDCSQAITLICKMAGLHDPNNLNYDGYGGTGSLLSNANLAHYTNPRDAHPGSLVIFGPGTGEHVAMVIEQNGDDPWLFSHGSNAGPLRVSLSDEAAAHDPPVVFLNIATL